MRLSLIIGALVLAGCNPDGGLSVKNDPPEVEITSPQDGAAVLSDTPLTLAIVAADLETPAESLTLLVQSDQVGPLNGELSWAGDVVSLSLPDGLPAGTHVIEAKVLDEEGADASDTITLEVTDNLPPSVSFVAPEDLAKVAEGRLVRVEATFADDRDDPAELVLEWGGAAAVDDAPDSPDSTGEATFYLEDLEVGQHILRVSVTDTLGATASSTLEIEVVPDADGDGFVSADSGGDDCDDSDPKVRPDAIEVCDGIDNDCDGATDEDDAADASTFYADVDEDGYGDPDNTRSACEAPTGFVDIATDCDDLRDHSHPGADELCDTFDNDCDGDVDEDDSLDAGTWFADLDGDGFGDPASLTRACAAPTDHVADNTDCDDTEKEVKPGATEVCNDVDDDCNGDVDDSAADAMTWYADADLDTFGDVRKAVLACDAPTAHVADDTDCDDSDGSINPDATEVCDGIDNDCDLKKDEPDAIDAETWYRDADKDSFGDPDKTVVACEAPGGYIADDLDCDDTKSDVNPDATEVCDSIDNDCDSTVDEADADDATTWYADTDSDGHGDKDVTTRACSAPAGYVSSDDDCDDDAATTNPDEDEVCDGEDNDCDTAIDEDATDAVTWYLDDDGDDYGLTGSTTDACDAPAGYAAASGDCDDEDDAVNPGATEVCNGIDDDCNSTVDDSPSDGTTFYIDSDGDGYGTTTTTTKACAKPAGYAATSDDCDDGVSTTYPGAPELCDSKDNDCDTAVDEDKPTWYLDDDGDGYGKSTTSTVSCSKPAGYVMPDGDCNDSDSSINPGASEVCNDIDDDCDRTVDEDATDADDYYPDDDGDGYGDEDGSVKKSCDPVSGYAIGKTDCDDADADVHPGAPEVCDGVDNDCDSATETALDVPGTYSTITVAITAASDGDTVCLAAGTYYETIDFAGKDIIVDGKAGADKVLLDGGGGGPVVTFEDGESRAAALTNVTVTGGDADKGAGVYINAADPTFMHVIIEGNSCTGYTTCQGTGMYVNGGDPLLVDVVVQDNEQVAGGSADVTFYGAGIYATSSGIELVDVDILDNLIDGRPNSTSYDARLHGAGAVFYLSDVALDHVDIIGNQALSNGSSSSTNTRIVEGGAVELERSSADLKWVRIVDNEAQSRVVYGLGLNVYTSSADSVTIENSIIGGNTGPASYAIFGGGAYLYASSGTTLQLTNVDLVGNAPVGTNVYGGGAYGTAWVELRNVNVAFNDSGSATTLGSDLYSFSTTKVHYTNFYDNLPTGSQSASSYTSSNGNKALNPGFTDVLPAAVEDWDLELTTSSAVRNLGDPTMYDPDGSRCGIGAYSGPDADGW